jgi:hypothetical protein
MRRKDGAGAAVHLWHNAASDTPSLATQILNLILQ